MKWHLLQVKHISLGNCPGDNSHLLTVMALLLTLFLFNMVQALNSSSICIRRSIQLSGVTYVYTYIISTCINIFISKDVHGKFTEN